MCFYRCIRCGEEFAYSHETEHDCRTEEDTPDDDYHGA